ncbi:MAG: hypothetical protein NTU95_05605 [Methanothrix sp.]|nr:hypothetical protein [Methanothrix sp.]
MSTSIEKRIEHLFSDRGSCLKEIARIFAERRGQWLVQEDIINLLGADYPNSTISNNFKMLSSPMKELNGHSYIETGTQESPRGRPAKKGRLSEAAFEVLFKLVASHTLDDIGAPASIQIGRVVIPPIVIKPDPKVSAKRPVCLLPNDIVALRKQKIGEKNADCMLRDIANKEYASDGTIYAEDFYDLKHHASSGRIPKLRRLTDKGAEEYASDTNSAIALLCAYLTPNWVGTWETDFGKLEIMPEIENEHPKYIGRYPNGTIEGKTETDTLIGTWHEETNSGDFEFTMFGGGQSFWGDRYDGAHRRLRGWSGKMVGHEKCSLK